MGAKRDTASYIVTRDRGSFKPPELDQLGEQTRLGRDRDVQPIPPLRLAKPEEVECVHGEAVSELRHDVAPDVRPARRPVHENRRWAFAKDVVGYLAAGESDTLS